MRIIHQTMQNIAIFSTLKLGLKVGNQITIVGKALLLVTSRVAILQGLIKCHLLLSLLLEGLYEQCFHNYQSIIFVPMAIRPSVLINIQIWVISRRYITCSLKYKTIFSTPLSFTDRSTCINLIASAVLAHINLLTSSPSLYKVYYIFNRTSNNPHQTT